ncbi:hypothetical protein GMMP15_850019 [Candidatus Magnetomoraceae bacterium gMMP-15]
MERDWRESLAKLKCAILALNKLGQSEKEIAEALEMPAREVKEFL